MIGKSDFIKCADYTGLPAGTYLVRTAEKDGRNDLHIAVVSDRITVVGGHFSWDRKPLIEYVDISHLIGEK
jgi:hypothetical protein